MQEGVDRAQEAKEAKPFFARFLEGQEYPHVKTDLKAGCNPKDPLGLFLSTCKYPSDSDDQGGT